jgi:hypothetical protein
MAFFSSDPEKDLCYTDHSNIKLDHTRQQCCFQDKEHSPAHVYDGDSTKESLLKVTSNDYYCSFHWLISFYAASH